MLKDILGRQFAICTPSERCSTVTNVPGRLGNGGGAKVVGLFETLLVTLSMLRMCSTYGGELIKDSVSRCGCLETITYAKQWHV